MPPKKENKPSKKTEMKKKEKIIEDKTFGLKNKKGNKTQKFIQQVEKQVKSGNQPAKKVEAAATAKKDDKKVDEFGLLFRPVQKIEKGADPKSVLCAFFKQGQCTKGDKCKFSHDLAIERKAEKRNIYEDVREQDTMDTWDEEKLAEVVETKHGIEKKMPKTDIICKHFIDALENSKYGWFWECPNGGVKCHYRHCLPPGFVLKKDAKKLDKEEEISIEDLVERERAQLKGNLTPVTYESFVAWKKRKIEAEKNKKTQESAKKKAEFQAGRAVGLSGRDMFTFRPELANDMDSDDEGDTFDMCQREDNEGEDGYRELQLEELVNLAGPGDSGKGTVGKSNGVDKSETLGGATAMGDAVPIDEDLFADELDDLDEELNDLEVSDREDNASS